MGYEIKQGDCLKILPTMPSESVQVCVTSPPYFQLRDYNAEGQIGLEETPQAFVAKMVEVFDEVKRVLKPDGTLWLNLGDSYASKGVKSASIKPKDLIGIPWRVAFALQEAGWWLRQDIIWAKPNPMPESVTDRCTKSHEYIFLLTKSQTYYYDNEAIKEPVKESSLERLEQGTPLKFGGNKYGDDPAYQIYSGKEWTPKGRDRSLPRNRNGITGSLDHKNVKEKGQVPSSFHVSRTNGEPDKEYLTANKRSVWNVALKPFKGAHFATFPPKLIEPCILAGSREGDTVLDPFNGSGTTGLVCIEKSREYIGIELNPEYVEMTEKRLAAVPPCLF